VALLKLNKKVIIFSPDWIRINQYLATALPEKREQFDCINISINTTVFTLRQNVFNIIKIRQKLVQTEKKHQCKADLVMFCPTDDWFLPKTPRKFIELFFNYKWTGIYLNLTAYYKKNLPLNVDPIKGEPDYCFSAKNCIGVVLMDRFKAREVQSRVYKKVVVFPDISLRPVLGPTKIAQQIKSMAAGRIIIGTLLLENENLEQFLLTALNAEQDKYFFVCAGNIEPAELNNTCNNLFSKLLESNLTNNYFVLHTLDDDEDINNMMQCFDICYLNYGNQMQTSTLLTKAALMHKPVIASKNDVIGKLVKTFKIGVCVGTDMNESLNALTMLSMQMPFEQNFDMEKLNNYASLQNESMLEESLEELLLF